MRWSLPILVAAMVVFLGSTTVFILALEQGSRALVGVAIFGMVVAAALFIASIWYPRRNVDWERIEMEQRLWESGPLGRSWLRVRRRLSDMWKI